MLVLILLLVKDREEIRVSEVRMSGGRWAGVDDGW